ncbi:MAG: hypothetical protein WCP98_04840 [Actinomycetes bacterium]
MSESPTRQLADEHEYVKLVVGAIDREVACIERYHALAHTLAEAPPDDSEGSA